MHKKFFLQGTTEKKHFFLTFFGVVTGICGDGGVLKKRKIAKNVHLGYWRFLRIKDYLNFLDMRAFRSTWKNWYCLLTGWRKKVRTDSMIHSCNLHTPIPSFKLVSYFLHLVKYGTWRRGWRRSRSTGRGPTNRWRRQGYSFPRVKLNLELGDACGK